MKNFVLLSWDEDEGDDDERMMTRARAEGESVDVLGGIVEIFSGLLLLFGECMERKLMFLMVVELGMWDDEDEDRGL